MALSTCIQASVAMVLDRTSRPYLSVHPPPAALTSCLNESSLIMWPGDGARLVGVWKPMVCRFPCFSHKQVVFAKRDYCVAEISMLRRRESGYPFLNCIVPSELIVCCSSKERVGDRSNVKCSCALLSCVTFLSVNSGTSVKPRMLVTISAFLRVMAVPVPD